MKLKQLSYIALLAMLLPLSGSALIMTKTYSHITSDNDNSTTEDASFGTGTIGTTSVEVTSTGSSSAATGYRFVGQSSAYLGAAINQYINATVTWNVIAEDWEEYSINFTPELHARLNIADPSGAEPNDSGVFPTLNTLLKVNGGTVSDTLGGLAGYTKTSNGSYDLNRTDAQVLTGYTGSNTFSLQVYGTINVTSDPDTGLFDDDSAVAVLWGQDGTLDAADNGATFDNYSSATARNADGIFVDATVSLDSIPEPATAMLLAVGGGFAWLVRLKQRS